MISISQLDSYIHHMNVRGAQTMVRGQALRFLHLLPSRLFGTPHSLCACLHLPEKKRKNNTCHAGYQVETTVH